MTRDESAIGRVGVIILATRGQAGPGEVRLRIRGGTESFIAWSQKSLPAGTTVLITDFRGRRTVDVTEWDDPLGEAPAFPGSSDVPHSGE